MNQETIILEFVKAVYETDELDYIELALLAVAKTPKETSLIKSVFQSTRDRRPLLLEIGGANNMNQNESWTLKIIRELAEMSIEELRDFGPLWEAELVRLNVPKQARGWAALVVRLVIEKKLEKRTLVSE